MTTRRLSFSLQGKNYAHQLYIQRFKSHDNVLNFSLKPPGSDSKKEKNYTWLDSITTSKMEPEHSLAHDHL